MSRDLSALAGGTVGMLRARPDLAAFAFSACMLSAALLSQALGGLQPCHLCILQRWAHALVIALATLAWALGGRARRPLTWVASIALFLSTGVASYHVGVEAGWWDAACAGALDPSRGVAALREAILAAAPAPRCDEVALRVLGLSMASWNALMSAAAGAVVAIILARKDV